MNDNEEKDQFQVGVQAGPHFMIDSFSKMLCSLETNSTNQVSGFSNVRVLTPQVIPEIMRLQDAALKLLSTNLWRSSILGGKISQAPNLSLGYSEDLTPPAHHEGPGQPKVQGIPDSGPHQHDLYTDERTWQLSVSINQQPASNGDELSVHLDQQVEEGDQSEVQDDGLHQMVRQKTTRLSPYSLAATWQTDKKLPVPVPGKISTP